MLSWAMGTISVRCCADANEEEIQSALAASEWKIEAAVKILKRGRMDFGFSINRAFCEMVLGGLD